MDRVATAMQGQTLLAQLLKTQKNMIDAQTQVTTGRKINNFADDPASIGGLMAAKTADAQTADFLATSQALKTRLDLQDTQIDNLASVASGLRQTMLDAVANNNGASISAEIQSALDQFKSILNSQQDGQYIYGGTRQDVPPVTVSTVADLAALPTTSAAFQNNQVTQSAKIDANQTVNFGKLASDLGGPVFDLIRQFAAFNAGPNGPINGDTLTPAQSSFLSGLANTASTAAAGINDQLATNGVNYRETDDAVSRHQDTRTTLAGMIHDIQDVDMASAIDKLNNAQLAMQASAKTYATVQGLSLLNFLPTS